MGKLPDPALHLWNKISDTPHQGSYCPRKLRNHTKHHQYNHANRKYDREEQAYRSCQFFDYLIFFFALPKIFFSKKLIGTLVTNAIAPPSTNGNTIPHIAFNTSSTTLNFHSATTRNAVNTISSRIFLQIFTYIHYHSPLFLISCVSI